MPRYQEVAEDLLRRMDSAEYPPGSYLPTKLDLQAEYQISLATLNHAFGLLLDAHRIDPQPGRGTQVLAPPAARPAGEYASDDDRLEALAAEFRNRLGTLSGEVARLAAKVEALAQRDAERDAGTAAPPA